MNGIKAGSCFVSSVEGFEIKISKNAKVGDLLTHLKIAESHRAVVAINGKIMKPDDILQNGDVVHIFQSVFGG